METQQTATSQGKKDIVTEQMKSFKRKFVSKYRDLEILEKMY